jgi:hypothetical protein
MRHLRAKAEFRQDYRRCCRTRDLRKSRHGFLQFDIQQLSGLLEREGWTLRTFVISREPRFDQGFYEMERAISEGALDAIFELCTNDLVVKWLEKDCAIPALINPMRFDYSCFVRMAFDRLLASGRSAPVLICDCEHIGESMLDGIFAGLEGGSISRIHSEPSMSCGYEAAKRLFESGRRFDSLIVLYDNTCRGVLYYLLEKGVELPSAVSLITHSNKGIELFSHIPLTRLEFDPDDFAKDMLLSIEARLAGRVHDAPLIKPVLIEGASCGERKRRRR